MKKILLITSVVAIIIIGIVSYSLPNEERTEQRTEQTPLDFDFSYDKMNLDIKNSLKNFGISMSSPLKLKEQNQIDQYCTFFDDEEKQLLIEYCTSTELKDSQGKFLGNIHMVGSPSSPRLIMTLIQVDPFMTQINEVISTFDVVIDLVVCDCWEDYSPNGFRTVPDWISGLREFHVENSKPNSKSKVMDLEDSKIQIELTTNKDGYLWKLLIAK